MARKKANKDGWSDNPLILIKQLEKEMIPDIKAGLKLNPKTIKNLQKIDKIFKKGLKNGKKKR